MEKTDYKFWFWFWFTFIAFVAVLGWGGHAWFDKWLSSGRRDSPFLRVTNREISLFLWQYPEHMRANAPRKTGYLPGFQYIEKVSVDPLLAEEYVEAPPELLFLYHTWHRLLGNQYFPRPIPSKTFLKFLDYATEWQPIFWHEAPQDYVAFVKQLSGKEEEKELDLESLPLTTLPLVVRQAFQGWHNFFIDKEAINGVRPTYGEMRKFLSEHPHYARNYWRNILFEARPQYLTMKGSEKDKVPENELTAFLREGFYNYMQASQRMQVAPSNLSAAT